MFWFRLELLSGGLVEVGRIQSDKLCECGCGQYTFIARHAVKKRGVVAGGPMKFLRGHGDAPLSPTYMTWQGMKQRCLYEGHIRFKHYGGRGIKLHGPWLKFKNFLADMGERPAGMSIDRIDNDGDYKPGNCRWADATTQARNKDTGGTLITVFGETKCIAAWARDPRCVANYAALYKRIARYKWPAERAITTPVEFRNTRQS